MTSSTPIKWRPTWKFWIPIIIFLVPLILEGQIFGTVLTPYVYSVLLIIYGLIYYFRTKLWQAILFTIVMAITICIYFLAARPERSLESFELIGIVPGPECLPWIISHISMLVWFGSMVVMSILFITIGPLLTKALDLETSAIRLFKLSARSVIGEQNGYTDRPFTAGQHAYNENELLGFASFLDGKKICLAKFPENGVKLMFSMGISPLCKKHQDDVSYVMFDKNGTLSVFISEHDYRQYRKHYSFDQLCEKMGNTFLRFAEYYKNHNENRVLTELKGA